MVVSAKLDLQTSSQTNRSVILEIIGSTEIGLKSDGVMGFLILGTGLIKANFHWFGTSDLDRLTLIRNVMGAEMTGAAILRNQKGSLSIPAAVDLSLSSALNTSYSVTA